MGIIGSILIFGGITTFVVLAIIGVFLLGIVLGRSGSKPKEGYVGFSTYIKKDIYTQLLDKGRYKSEQAMLMDALTLLNWGLETSGKGRFIASCEHDGSKPTEFPMETLANLRSLYNPVNHLMRCLGLKIDEPKEEDDGAV
jgi:hypothetical protein